MSDVADVVPVLRELAATLAGIRDGMQNRAGDGWAPDSAKLLIQEMHAQRTVSRALVSVLGDVRDELHLFRTELRHIREREDREARFRQVAAAAVGGGG